ncbi:MAG TPA: flippase-like domain-containing protein [Nannocystis exedens]|nr:flippase-like domain-containing protein [Nannocystis exedens]
MASSRKSRLFAAAKLLLGIALMIAVVRWLSPDLNSLRARASLDLGALAIALGCTLFASIVTSARWKIMVEAMGGTHLPYRVYFHGLVLTKVIGQFTSALAMDLVGRGLALRSAGSERGLGHAMTQAIVERLFDVLLPAVLVLWALTIHNLDPSPGAVAISFAGLCLLFAGLAVILLWPLARTGLRLYLAIASLRGHEIPLNTRAELLNTPISPKLAAHVGVLSVLRYVAVLGQFWAVAAAIGIDLSFRTIASATPLGQLAGILAITPGGLGIQEAGWAGAFRWLGVLDDPAIGLFVLSQRVLIFAFFGLFSLLSWLWLRQLRRHPN